MNVSLPRIGQAVRYSFPHVFTFTLVVEWSLEDKTFPTMDLLVHGEPDDIYCTSVEDCIRKL